MRGYSDDLHLLPEYSENLQKLSADIVRSYEYGDVANRTVRERQLQEYDIYTQDDLVERLGQHVQVEFITQQYREDTHDSPGSASDGLRTPDSFADSVQYAQQAWRDIRETLDIVQHGGNTTVAYKNI